MNRKGFTLIEIIGAIIILGIIGIISIQFFTKSETKFRNDFYNTIEANFLTSGKEFYTDNRIYRPKDTLNASKVTLNTLEQKSYTDEILDYNSNSCNKDSYVIVINMGNGEYVYNACLKCEEDEYDNTIDNKYCDPVWDDTTSTTIKLTLEPPEPIYVYKNTSRDEVRELTAIRASIVKLDYEGNVLSSVNGIEEETIPQIYPDNIDIIDTSKVGTYNITYTYQNKTVNGQVVVYENGAPFIKIEKENTVRRNVVSSVKTIEKTNYVSGTWGQKLIITFGQGSDGSYNDANTKVVRYQWKRNGRWIDLCTPSNGDECVAVITEEMNEAVYFRAIDTMGNISNETTTPTILRIDNTLPKCKLKLEGTIGDDNWYTSDVKISFVDSETKDLVNIKSEAVSGIKSSGITLDTIDTIQTKTQTDDTTSVTWYGFIEDNAENSTLCEITFKKDATKPIVTYSVKEGAYNITKNVVITPSDATSRVRYYNVKVYKDGSIIEQYNNLTTNSQTVSLSQEGLYNVATYIIDNAGNVIDENSPSEGMQQGIKYNIDKTPPECTVNVTQNNHTSGVSFNWSCEDPGSGIEGISSGTVTNRTSNWNLVVNDNAGNSTTVTVNIASKTQYRSRSCTSCYSYSSGGGCFENCVARVGGSCDASAIGGTNCDDGRTTGGSSSQCIEKSGGERPCVYRYQNPGETYTNCSTACYAWSGWGGWTDSVQTASCTASGCKEVQTQTLYYKSN